MSCHFLPQGVGEECRTAPSGIHVEMDLMLFSSVCQELTYNQPSNGVSYLRHTFSRLKFGGTDQNADSLDLNMVGKVVRSLNHLTSKQSLKLMVTKSSNNWEVRIVFVVMNTLM